MTEQVIARPCKFMIYNKNGYHDCEILSAQYKGNFVCAYFYDLCNPTIPITVTFVRIPQEKPNIQWGQPERRETTEDDVPNICPLKYTWKEIDSRIFLLNQKFIHSKKHIREMKELEKSIKDWPKNRWNGHD